MLKKTRRTGAVALAVFLMFMMAACQAGKPDETAEGSTTTRLTDGKIEQTTEGKTTPRTSEPQTTETGSGNSSANLVNGGFIARDDSWYYYHNVYDQFFLYKIKPDGTGKAKLTEDKPWYINVVGDWVYYANAADDHRLYRVRTDGTGRELLLDERTSWVTVVDGWIYFVKGVLGSICRVRTDGSDLTQLNDDSSGDLFVCANGLYFLNYSEDQKIYKISLDGGKAVQVNDVETSFFIVADDQVYFRNEDDEALYAIKTDGSQLRLITEGGNTFRSVNILDDWLYYPLGWFFRIRTDGQDKTQISDDKRVTHVHVFDEWIIYYDSNTDAYYRISPDGKTREKFG